MRHVVYRLFFVALYFTFATTQLLSQRLDIECVKFKYYFYTEQWETALESIGKCLEKNEDTDFFLERGIVYFHMEEYEKAIANLMEAVKNDYNHASYFLARIYSKKGDKAKCFENLEIHLQGIDKQPRSEIMLHPDFQKYEYTDQWNQLFEYNWYSQTELFFEEIDYLVENENYFDAIKQVSDTIRKKPGLSDFYALRGDCYHKAGNIKWAIKNYSSSIELDEENAGLFASRAKLYALAGKNKKARNDYSKSLDIDPYQFDLYLERAKLLLASGNMNKAIDDMEFILSLDSSNLEAKYLLSVAYFKQNDFLQALRLLNQCIKADPNKVNYYIMRGDIYYQTKSYKLAVKDYNLAMDIERSAELMIKTGEANLAAGDKKAACENWKIARELGSLEVEKLLYEYCE